MASKMTGIDSDLNSIFELTGFNFFNFDEMAKI